jgi:hypothetical protein
MTIIGSNSTQTYFTLTVPVAVAESLPQGLHACAYLDKRRIGSDGNATIALCWGFNNDGNGFELSVGRCYDNVTYFDVDQAAPNLQPILDFIATWTPCKLAA